MNGRMYCPTTGRFLSADALVQNPGNTQSFNRYSYCLNNPLKYTDPSGWIAEDRNGYQQLRHYGYEGSPAGPRPQGFGNTLHTKGITYENGAYRDQFGFPLSNEEVDKMEKAARDWE